MPLHIGLVHHKIQSILKAAKIPNKPSYYPGPAPGHHPEKNKASLFPKLNSSARLGKPLAQEPKRHSPEESRRKTSLPKPTMPVHLSASVFGVGKSVSPIGNLTPDKSRRESILSNCDTPLRVIEPIDEFITKSGARPEKGSQNTKNRCFSLNCNYELNCEVCGKAQKTPLAMEFHTIAHYKEDLEARVSCHMTGDNKCKICGDSFKTKNWLVNHLGSKHGFINDVLSDKGFAVLPCQVKSTEYKDFKQEQLMKIKTERKGSIEEEEEQVHGLRDELMEETRAREKNS